eukprot:1545636-Pleurochrysis_carterae.AAC.1
MNTTAGICSSRNSCRTRRPFAKARAADSDITAANEREARERRSKTTRQTRGAKDDRRARAGKGNACKRRGTRREATRYAAHARCARRALATPRLRTADATLRSSIS